jgi:hypothetical protein
MLEPRDWDENYVFNLPIGEFDWLEVKGRRALDLTIQSVNERDVRQNLSRALSAFANSGGGIIVFGLSDPTTRWTVDDGGVDLHVKNPNTREWLEDVIPNLVDAPLSKFNVYVIQRNDATSQILEGRGIFIVEILDSEQAPHQANDHKYYARVGGRSRPIGHKLVADIFGRQQYPKIELEFEIKITKFKIRLLFDSSSMLLRSDDTDEYATHAELVTHAQNIGRILARYMNCSILIPVALVPQEELEVEYSENDFKHLDGIL